MVFHGRRCLYLANRGIKTANIPVVPGCPLPISLNKVQKPFFVGLTIEPMMLVRIRRERLDMLKQTYKTEYTDLKAVSRELTDARRMFAQRGWPVVDVTHKPIEETAATILQFYERSAGTSR